MQEQLPVLLMLLTLFYTAGVMIAQTPTEGVAENFSWYCFVANSVERIQAPQQVVASMDGNLFASNMLCSKECVDSNSVFNYSIPNVADKAISFDDDGEAANGSVAISIYKTTPEGKLLWHIYNSRGDVHFDVHYITATPDGGFMTILMVRDTKSKLRTGVDILRLIQADGKPYNIEVKSRFIEANEDVSAGTTHRKIMPTLVRVSATGQIEYHKAFEVDHEPMPDTACYSYGTPTGRDFKGTVIDPEGNVYVCGFVRTAITIGETTIKVRDNVGWDKDSQKDMGDFFILKFDNKDNLVETLTKQEAPIGRPMLYVIEYQDGKLYTTGHFTGAKEKTPITIDDKQLIPSDKESLVTLCLNTDLKVSWISQTDVRAVPSHGWMRVFVDGIAVGRGKIYIAGHCTGALVDAERNVILEQKLKQYRDYALALDKATGKPNAKWHTLLPKKGASNCTTISTQGGRVILHTYTLFGQTYYRVLDLNFSESSIQDYPAVSKASVSFGGDVIANSYVATSRCRDGAKLPTTEGYKEMTYKGWLSLFVTHKLPFPSVSANYKALHLSESKGTLQVLASNLKDSIQVTRSDKGFTAQLKELPAMGGALGIQFETAVIGTSGEHTGKLTLTSSSASYEIYLYAMTETEQYTRASQNEADFSTIPVGEHKPVDLTVTQKNLMSAIACMIKGEGAKYYSVDKSEITISSEPVALKVTYTPDKAVVANAKATAQLVLTSDDVKTAVTLSDQANIAIEEIVTTKLSAATVAGTLCIHSDVARPVAIYTLAGEIVVQQLLSGDMEIALSTDVYFIQAARETYRVCIPAI